MLDPCLTSVLTKKRSLSEDPYELQFLERWFGAKRGAVEQWVVKESDGFMIRFKNVQDMVTVYIYYNVTSYYMVP